VVRTTALKPAAAIRASCRFLPRRNRFVFRVKVPASFTAKDELIWTLTTNGVTEKAYASLRDDYKVDDVVKASETGALGAGSSSPEIRSNKPPVVKVEGSKTLTAKVGQPLTLSAVVTDDGIPKRRRLGGLSRCVGQPLEPGRWRRRQRRCRSRPGASPCHPPGDRRRSGCRYGGQPVRVADAVPQRGAPAADPHHGRQECGAAPVVARVPCACRRTGDVL
jgi:hypothetical protein